MGNDFPGQGMENEYGREIPRFSGNQRYRFGRQRRYRRQTFNGRQDRFGGEGSVNKFYPNNMLENREQVNRSCLLY